MTTLFQRFNVQPVLRLAIGAIALMALGVFANAQERMIQASFTNNGQPVKIDVQVGQSRVIEFDAEYERIAISDEKIAQVIPINFRQAIVNGLTFGQVNLVAWAKKKEGDPERLVAFDIYVLTNLSLIDNQIKVLFPKENIQLSQVNSSVVLSGSVTKPELADQVQKIIEAAGLKSACPQSHGSRCALRAGEGTKRKPVSVTLPVPLPAGATHARRRGGKGAWGQAAPRD